MRSSLIILSVLFLTFTGLIFTLNTTYIRYPPDPYLYVKKQAVAVLIGLSLMVAVIHMRVELLRKIASPLMMLLFFLCLLTLFVGKGPGVRRWLALPGFSFQPSELFKVILPLFLANIVTKMKNGGELDFQKSVTVLMIGFGLSIPIAFQPDFGNFAFCVLMTIYILFLAGAKLRYILAMSLPSVVTFVLFVVSSPYRLKRITMFLDPWKDPHGSGYQIIQSMISYASGGVTGKGIGDGIQKLFFLPSAHTDFIVSVIAEELGFMGILTLVIALSVIAVVGFTSALASSKDEFLMLVTAGSTFCLTFQGLLNLLVTVGLVPTKGLTFPFVSYGGSSVISSFLCSGIIIASVSRSKSKR